ncbi:MAG: citramalate synthase [Candidatus Caenarcaniphilales bacterium]|nr:citramalate synthase [Candidatus Caenarcaniphilales bacterium]
MSKSIDIYDTTLRDGAQMHGISFSVDDKIKIAQLLDELGVAYIEGGWPGANPKDIAFFERASQIRWHNAKLAAFGSTRRVDSASCEEDPILQALIKAETPVITIVGKAWHRQVETALRTTLTHNLDLISESILHLKSKSKEVIFDAEHFFDGYKENADYALEVAQTVMDSGADALVLCDTNGGTLPHEISEIVQALLIKFPKASLGIHCHNDGGVAVANSLAAVLAGTSQIQGTINGYGERCGNADLVTLIASLELKLGYKALADSSNLNRLTEISHLISEIANFNPTQQQPYVGRLAFMHKGGLHASALQRDKSTYEHIDPELVGNKSRVIVSEQSGISNVLDFARTRGLGELTKEQAREILVEIKDREHDGYQYEQASASLFLLCLKHLGRQPKFFEVIDFRVVAAEGQLAEATVQLRVGDHLMHTASLGVGPGHALDNALRKALTPYYEALPSFKLSDFKVRVVDSHDGTAAKTRVNVETSAHGNTWNTVGVHENILQATFIAISESIEYGLYASATATKHQLTIN